MKQAIHIAYPAVVAWLLVTGCAQIRGIEGGEKDARPPALVAAYPPPLTTSFAGNVIQLVFDEYVQLGNLQEELVVSPPLSRPVKGEIRRKSVVLTLQEQLLPNTTYTFSFGNAISDFHEGNVLDFNYVISTGTVIDSLRVSGRIRECWTGKPAGGVRVMLYADTSAGNVLEGMPLYCTRADEEGNYLLDHLAGGRYHLVALDDRNPNYRLDAGELVAFQDSLLRTGIDTLARDMCLSSSLVQEPRWGELKPDSSGMFRMPWDYRLPLPGVRALEEGLQVSGFSDAETDSATWWLTGVPPDTETPVAFSPDGFPGDTLLMPFFRQESDLPFGLSGKPPQKLVPGSDRELRFSRPLAPGEPARVTFMADDSSGFDAELRVDDLRPDRAHLHVPGLPPGAYTVEIPPGELASLNGAPNDTIRWKAGIAGPDELGLLKVACMAGNLSVPVTVELRNKLQGQVFRRRVSLPGEVVFGQLEPAEYELRMWQDQNANGRWDGVDFFSRVQPEWMRVFDGAIQVRANWEQTISWDSP